MKKKLLFTLAILLGLLVILGVLEKLNVIDLIHSSKPSAGIQNSGPTAAEKEEESKINSEGKKNLIENGTTTPSSTTPNSTSIDLTAKTETNSSVTILTKLYSIASGQCSLHITNNGKQVQQTVEVIYQTEYSTCAGFSVPISSLGSGTWNISLNVTSNGQTFNKELDYAVQ